MYVQSNKIVAFRVEQFFFRLGGDWLTLSEISVDAFSSTNIFISRAAFKLWARGGWKFVVCSDANVKFLGGSESRFGGCNTGFVMRMRVIFPSHSLFASFTIHVLEPRGSIMIECKTSFLHFENFSHNNSC